MALSYPNKDPDAVLDYGLDWTAWLPSGDTIQSSEWIVTMNSGAVVMSGGLVVDSSTHDSNSTLVWLSGGDAGTTYKLTNRIITTDGRTQDQTVSIIIEER